MGALRRLGRPSGAPDRVQAVLRSPGRPLEPAVRSRMEAGLGHDLGGVRVHTGPLAAASARSVGARAYAAGRDLVFGLGRYAPETRAGFRLLAHELTHVVQQRGGASPARHLSVEPAGTAAEVEADTAAERVASGGRAEIAQRRTPRIARQGAEDQAPVTTASGETLWFELDSDELRHDADVNAVAHLLLAVERIERHGEAVGDEQQVLLHGYASVEGEEGHNVHLAGQRAIRVKNLLIDFGIPSRRIVVLAHGPDATFPGLEWNRRVEIELSPEQPLAVQAPYCECPTETEVFYDDETYRFITAIAPLVIAEAQAFGVSPLPVAGAIADEYDTRRPPGGRIDELQDGVVDRLPEWTIDIDRFLDIEPKDLEPILGETLTKEGAAEKGAKLLNTLENDIGPANIKVRTALALVDAGVITVPGSPPSDVKVRLIIDFLLSDPGTVTTTAAVIARAQVHFGPWMGAHSEPLQHAVLVEYFKQGDKLFLRFIDARTKDPARVRVPCPGLDGCQFLHNYERLAEALGVPSP